MARVRARKIFRWDSIGKAVQTWLSRTGGIGRPERGGEQIGHERGA
jgi:hypothetical protein